MLEILIALAKTNYESQEFVMIALSHHRYLKKDGTEFSRHGPVRCRPAAPRMLFTYWVVDMLMAVHSQ